jgi:hypothetical protein
VAKTQAPLVAAVESCLAVDKYTTFIRIFHFAEFKPCAGGGQHLYAALKSLVLVTTPSPNCKMRNFMNCTRPQVQLE